jgi:branched-chain amino acid transport system substrate-binding protein
MGRSCLTRRAVIAGAGGLALAPRLRAQDRPPPLVIGVLTDRSGIGASVSGPPLVQAVRMAAEDAPLMPDRRPLSVVTDSFQLKSDDALAVARRWFDQGVSVIVDVPGASAATAVQALARSRGRTTLITGSLDPELTGRGCSPFGSHWSIDSASMTTALARTMARVGTKSWFLVVPDTVLGLAVQADAIHAIEAAGGQIAASSRHPAETTDFTSIVAQAKASGAQAVGLCDITGGLTAQLSQFQASGLFAGGLPGASLHGASLPGDRQKVVAFLPAITDIHSAGAAAAQGLLLASSFYWDQNDQARSFANRFLTATGQMPDSAHASAYVAVRHYLRAAAVTDGLDADVINQEMRRTPVYFFGRPARLRLDGRLALDLSLLRAKSPEAMRGEWDHYEQIGVVPAADVFRPVNITGCQLGR